MKDPERLGEPLRVERQYKPHKPRGYWPVTTDPNGVTLFALNQHEVPVVTSALGLLSVTGVDETMEFGCPDKAFDLTRLNSISEFTEATLKVLKGAGFQEQQPTLTVKFVEPVEG